MPEYFWTKYTIKSFRLWLDESQVQFSNRLGCRQQTISDWELGILKPNNMSRNLLTRVAIDVGVIQK